MTMLHYFGPRYAKFDAGLLATDLSLPALRQASAGVYSPEQVEHVPAALRRYFKRRRDGAYEVAPEVRAEGLFRKFNLTAAPYPFKKPFHVIFCRNVMIYMDAPTRGRLVESLHHVTAPGGYLITGLTETIGAALDFQAVQPAVHKRPDEGRHP